MTHPIITRLRSHGQVSAREEELLVGALTPARDIRAREDFILEGSKPRESTVLVDGIAARYKIDLEGSRSIVAIHIPGDFIDLHSFLLNQMDHSVSALDDCVIATMPHQTIESLTAQHRGIARILWQSTLIDSAMHRGWVSRRCGEAISRTAHLICELYTRFKTINRLKDATFGIPLTQTDLGDALCLSTVHVNRVLQDLRSQKLITWIGREVTVLNFETLAKIGSFDPLYLNLVQPPRSASQ